jgi:hypothetical protein
MRNWSARVFQFETVEDRGDRRPEEKPTEPVLGRLMGMLC